MSEHPTHGKATATPTDVALREKDDAAKASTADRLLRTAAAFFWKKGFSATTTRELSEHLGIQRASLYHHIKTKEDLLYTISMDSLSRIKAAVMATAAESAPEGRLEAVILAHLSTALSDRDFHATMLTELRALSPKRRREVLERRDEYEILLRNIIIQEQNMGKIRNDLDARYLTLSLLNLLNWTIFWFDPKGELSVPQISEVLSAIYLNGARVQNGAVE